MLKIIINKTFQNVQTTFKFFEFFELLKSQNTLTLLINNKVENNNN